MSIRNMTMNPTEYKLHFAPLQGYTDRIFRNAFEEYFPGIDVYYTPFIRVERGGCRRRDLRDIDPLTVQVSSLVPQILPGTKEEFRMLVGMLHEAGYKAADINLGCPFPMIAGKSKGAGMLPYPEKVREVLGTITEFPGMNFSLKMRLGWENPCEYITLMDEINDLRLSWITLHPRTGKQQYKGNTDQEAFACFYHLCKHPLLYNGDLTTMEDICIVLEKFPLLTGVSVGRGLVSSPLLVKEFRQNGTFSEEQRMELYFAFHETLFEAYCKVLQGESQILMKMKTLWEYFLPHTDRKLLKRIKKATKLEQYSACIKEIFSRR